MGNLIHNFEPITSSQLSLQLSLTKKNQDFVEAVPAPVQILPCDTIGQTNRCTNVSYSQSTTIQVLGTCVHAR